LSPVRRRSHPECQRDDAIARSPEPESSLDEMVRRIMADAGLGGGGSGEVV
jgi:hypothetical protein